ncbi:MAG TPA: peptide ABC transporter substrate-binding protein [Candidatus Baltobacteraceae bacterium]|nr:peptide ABC transporter substrate-binding protein [Candidatus Baltobacteraceae bacterium]
MIVAGWIAGPDGFNPLTAVGSAARMAYYQLFSPIVDVGPNLLPRWKTSLAQRIEIADGGKRYVLHLRRNARWTDGEPLTSRDVVFSLQLGQNPALLEGNSSDFALMTQVRALDRYTVELRLAKPSPPFLLNALGEALPLPAHLLAKYPPLSAQEAAFVNTDAQFAQHPVSDGPYRLLRNVSQSYTILERNPAYWGPPAKTARIAFRVYPQQDSLYAAVDAGEIDVTDIPPNLWRIHNRLRGDHKFVNWPWNVTFLLLPNYHDPGIPFMHDPHVKQALMYAINRQFITGGIMSGQADILNGPVPGFSPHYDNRVQKYAYDPARANAMLDAAGWHLQNGVRMKDGKALRVTLKTGGATDAVASNIAELIQANFKAVGVDCVLENEEIQTFFEDLHASRFQLALRGVILQPYPDDYKWYGSSQTRAQGGYNYGFFSDPQIDRAIEDARTATSVRAAQAGLDRYQELAARELPVLYLYSNRLGAVVPSGLTGYDLTPSAPAALPMGLQFWQMHPGAPQKRSKP